MKQKKDLHFRVDEKLEERLKKLKYWYEEHEGLQISDSAFLRYVLKQGVNVVEKKMEKNAVAVTDAD